MRSDQVTKAFQLVTATLHSSKLTVSVRFWEQIMSAQNIPAYFPRQIENSQFMYLSKVNTTKVESAMTIDGHTQNEEDTL